MATAEVVLKGGMVIDGRGSAARPADIAISHGRIEDLGALHATCAIQEIRIEDKIVAPGFIDVHTHDDCALLTNPSLPCKISQGITTVVVGNCGLSLYPLKTDEQLSPEFGVFPNRATLRFPDFASYTVSLMASRPAVNVLCLVGHAALRASAMSELSHPASDSETALMKQMLRRALADGSIGLSTCLCDPGSAAATTEEVIALVDVVGEFGGIYATHLRNESDDVIEALEEALEIGLRCGVTVQISHHKCAGLRNHGRSRETLALIEQAREHQPVALDVYPYVAASTFLDVGYVRDSSRTIIAWSDRYPAAAGRDLAAFAQQIGEGTEAVIERLQPAGAIYFMMDEEDVRRILCSPFAMIGSDGLPHDRHPHPRLWGAFPRCIGHYARDMGLFPIEEAVRRVTSLPAAQFGIVDRGVITPGAAADLVVFDPNEIRDNSSFDRPLLPCTGVHLVMVNGQIVWSAGAPTGCCAGQLIKKPDLGRMGMINELPVQGGRI